MINTLFNLSSNCFSKVSSCMLRRLRCIIIPPYENKRSTGADDGSAILYFIKTSLTIGNVLSESKHVSSFCKYCKHYSSIVFLTEVFATLSSEDDPPSKAKELSSRVVSDIYIELYFEFLTHGLVKIPFH